MQHIISGIQQIGVGVTNAEKSWKWYRKNLGFDIPIVNDKHPADRMMLYTGGKAREKHAIIAINLQGGGGVEIWQYLKRKPKQAEFEIQAGDFGVFAGKIKSSNLEKAFNNFKNKKIKLLSEIETDPKENKHFFFEDLNGNIFQMVEDIFIFANTDALSGGIYGAIIGVSDIEKSIKFYKEVLGYDVVEFKETGIFKDFSGLKRGNKKFDRALLSHRKPRKGAFSEMFGNSQIELIKIYDETPKKIYENRYWGDPGFIQICFDIRNMKALKKHCENNGHPFTVDSLPESYQNKGTTFEMGDAAGHFTYIEDPDGTLIEFVETHKIPIIKKIGWNLNLLNRKPEKTLPKWMLKTLAWNRIK